MSFLDKTFCASPNCTNECGRKMTKEQRKRYLDSIIDNPDKITSWTSWGYFCGEPDKENPSNLESESV